MNRQGLPNPSIMDLIELHLYRLNLRGVKVTHHPVFRRNVLVSDGEFTANINKAVFLQKLRNMDTASLDPGKPDFFWNQ